MTDFFKNRCPLFVILILFIAFKLPHLAYPFYWDESWPYATAVHQMYVHGPSLMPGSIDGTLSRGHPLFFHAAAALWMKIFGPSHISMHSFALFISVCLIISVYEVGLRLFNKRVAIMAILLLVAQVLFFVQSAFVMPEVLVALLAFLSLYFYVSGRHLLTALFLTALFYTKESGLFIGAVIGIDALLNLFNTNRLLRQRISSLSSVAVPVLLIGIFFLLQKHISGWYVLPLYTDLNQQTDFGKFYYNFCKYLTDLFYNKSEYYYYIALLVLALLVIVIKKSYTYLFLLLPFALGYILVHIHLAHRVLPLWLWFTLFTASIISLAYILKEDGYFNLSARQRFFYLSVFIFLSYVMLSACVNCIIFRYMITALVFALFWLAVIYDRLCTASYPNLFYLVLLFIACIAAYVYKTDDDYGDGGLKAFDAMKVHQGVVDYLEKTNAYNKAIGTGMYLEHIHLQDPATGFLHSDKVFTNVRWDIDSQTQYAVFDNIEGDYRYEGFKKDSTFQLAYRIEIKGIWAEIYKRK